MKKRIPLQFSMAANVIISTVGLFCILIIVNYLSLRHYTRIDMTGSGIYTLSDKSIAVSKSLKEKITVYLLWSKSDPVESQIEELLKEYKNLSEYIKIEILDPDEDPEQFEMIQKKYAKIKVDDSGQAGVEAGIFVKGDKRVKFIPAESFEQTVSEINENGESSTTNFIAEQKITAAIIGVSSNKSETICFTQNHEEWSLEEDDGLSLKHIVKGLTLDGFKSRKISLLNGGAGLKECSLIVVAGPKKAFFKDEVETLESFYNDGGRLILLLDPIFRDDKFLKTALQDFVRRNGIEIEDDFIIETDPSKLVNETPITFIASMFFNHQAVKPLYDRDGDVKPVLFSSARSLKQIDGENNSVSDILAQASKFSWGETDLSSLKNGEQIPSQDEFDIEGPLNIVMSSVKQSPLSSEFSRLVVVGDSDFLSPQLFIEGSLYNRDLWSSLVGWTLDRGDMISIAPKDP
ncbi:MAG: GldG family protein, partial [Deltaproteobacteria bacterium]|nr:GldG family protein [Deltaproteobacteria bacterium]